MMFQSFALFPHLSALDNVAFSLKMKGVAKAERLALAQDLLERVRLSHIADEPVSSLAHGQQRQLEIGMALDVLERFEGIGLQIMNRTAGNGMMSGDPIAGILSDPSKRKVTAQMLGQAYVVAHNLVTKNRSAVEKIADAVLEIDPLFAVSDEQLKSRGLKLKVKNGAVIYVGSNAVEGDV